MRTTPDLTLATLVYGYLTAAASITAGVPDATTLPKALNDSGGVQTLPQLVVTGGENGDSSGARRTVDVVILLHALVRATGAAAAADAATLARTTPRATLGAWMDAIERRLRDRAAFSAYLATLSEDDLAGFTLMSWRVRPQHEIKRDEKSAMNAVTLAAAVELVVAWAR